MTAQQLLRLVTAGSVDDGKSTLIGRLLFDSKTIFTDQLAGIERTSRERGEQYPNLALLTDGLRAEREQGITIDVAYRYFATPRRKFIVADCPGHTQYTRNMVTGASTADVALILVDARKGVLEQSRRHAFLASLLGIPHLVLCVNKMDAVSWSQDRFEQIREEFGRFAMKLDVHDLTFVPVSALRGDNIVHHSMNMAWYEGTPLLHHLEEVHVASDRNLIDARFPVQYVIRDHSQDFRGYAGTVAGGILRPGDEVVVLPSGFTSTVTAVRVPGGKPLAEAFASQAVTLELADNLDVGRGDLICRPGNQPHAGQDIDAMVCWFAEGTTLTPGSTYTIQHTTMATSAEVSALDYRLDVNTLHRDKSASALSLNEIGRVHLRTRHPLMFDPYRRNRATGSFILIDDATNNTCGVGVISGPSLSVRRGVQHAASVGGQMGPSRGLTVWLSGPSTWDSRTIARELKLRLAAGRPVVLLDDDNLRHGLNADLGRGAADQAESVRRVGEIARLLAHAGVVAVVSLDSSGRTGLAEVRRAHERAGLALLDVFVDTPLKESAQDTDMVLRLEANDPIDAIAAILRRIAT
ncbi:bifunctional sulfate adenylyltransferase subunit 1/adenylylsulfate kinase [Streptomyces sp. JNUCC 63]